MMKNKILWTYGILTLLCIMFWIVFVGLAFNNYKMRQRLHWQIDSTLPDVGVIETLTPFKRATQHLIEKRGVK